MAQLDVAAGVLLALAAVVGFVGALVSRPTCATPAAAGSASAAPIVYYYAAFNLFWRRC